MSLRVGWGYFPWCEAKLVTEAEANAMQQLGGYAYSFATSPTGREWVAARAVDARCRAHFETLERRVNACLGKMRSPAPDRNAISDCVDRVDSVWGRIMDSPFGLTAWASWVFYCVVAGFLIGLGGPFWFNVYSNLNRVLQVARQVGGVLGRTETKEDQKPEAPAGGARKPTNPVEAFERAAGANVIQGRDVAGDWETWRARMRGRIPWTPH